MSLEPKRFDTDSRRIARIRNASEKHEISAKRLSDKQTSDESEVKTLQALAPIIKNFQDLSQDWTPMTVAVRNFEEPSIGQLREQYISWEIVFDKINELLISFINVDVLLRVGSGAVDDGALLFNEFNKQVIFNIENLPNESSNNKKVIMYVTVYFDQSSILTQYEAKLLVKIFHPQKDI